DWSSDVCSSDLYQQLAGDVSLYGKKNLRMKWPTLHRNRRFLHDEIRIPQAEKRGAIRRQARVKAPAQSEGFLGSPVKAQGLRRERPSDWGGVGRRARGRTSHAVR